jgi:hypothetical protein
MMAALLRALPRRRPRHVPAEGAPQIFTMLSTAQKEPREASIFELLGPRFPKQPSLKHTQAMARPDSAWARWSGYPFQWALFYCCAMG